MENQIDGMTRLCKTARFQQMMFEFLKAFVPLASEEMMDLLFILRRWNCTNTGILQSTAEPSPDTAATEPGVPVGLLMFVLEKIIPPDAGLPEFPLFKAANEMLCQFYAALEVARDLGRTATLSNFPMAQCVPFVHAAREFAMAYVRYTHPTTEAVQAVVHRVVPMAIEQLNEGRPDGVMLYLKIKTLFFGLHGISLTTEILEEMMGFVQAEDSLLHQMQAVSVQEHEE